jgi:hypothetical protein
MKDIEGVHDAEMEGGAFFLICCTHIQEPQT